MLLLAMVITLMVYVHSTVHWLEIFPESIWAIFIGIVLGIYLLYNEEEIGGLYERLQFDPHTFFLFILPPIMFQAGFSLNTKIFFKNIVGISSFAIFATLIAAFTFSLLFYYGMAYTDNFFPYLESLQFGCFISAIDPVATISIFQAMHVNDKVYMVVFGESTLNDAVAIALSNSVSSLQETTMSGIEPDYQQIIIDSLIHFFIFFFVSLLIGIIISILTSLLFVKLDLDLFPWLEIGLFLQLAYMPYIIAEAMELSGILAILAAGITMRNYAFYSLSPCGKITVEYLIETIGYTCENFCFAYLGISVPLMINYVNPYMVLIGCVALITSRFFSIASVALVLNCIRKEKIPFSHQLVMTYGGLRGAVAFYLALNLKDSEYKDQLTTLTIVLILFTVVGLGSTTTCVLRILNKCCERDKILQAVGEDEDDKIFLLDDDLDGRSDVQSEGLITRLESFDENFGKYYLRKDYNRNALRKQSSLYPSEAPSDLDGEQPSHLEHQETVSVASKHEDIIDAFFNRGVRGGDMSPFRNTRLLFRQKTQRKESGFKSISLRTSMESALTKKKTSMFAGKIERFEGPAVQLPGLTTTKAADQAIPRDLDSGFGSLFQPETLEPYSAAAAMGPHTFGDVKQEQNEDEEKDEELDHVDDLETNQDKQVDRAKKGQNKRQKYTKKLSTLLEEDEENDSDLADSKDRKESRVKSVPPTFSQNE